MRWFRLSVTGLAVRLKHVMVPGGECLAARENEEWHGPCALTPRLGIMPVDVGHTKTPQTAQGEWRLECQQQGK